MDVRPFTIAVEDSVLEDLRKRLTATRWPDEIPNTGWDYGSNLPRWILNEAGFFGETGQRGVRPGH